MQQRRVMGQHGEDSTLFCGQSENKAEQKVNKGGIKGEQADGITI